MTAKGQYLGQGTFGVVTLKDIRGEKFAVKTEKDQYSYRFCTGIANLREIDACQRVNEHPSIVTTFHKQQKRPIINSKGGDHSFMEVCMEVANGDLYSFMSSMNRKNSGKILDQSLTIVMQVLLGLEWMKAKGIVHRDISPANILFDKERSDKEAFFITDFGCFENIGDSLLPPEDDEMTTSWYRSPEAALHIATDDRVDIWSLGCIFFELLTNEAFLLSPELRSIPKRNVDIAILRSILCTSIEEPPSHFMDKFPAAGSKVRKMKTFRERLRSFEGESLDMLVDFFKILLKVDFHERATATEALAHPMMLKDEKRASYIRMCRDQFPPIPPAPLVTHNVDDHISVKKGVLCSLILKASSLKKGWTLPEHTLAIIHGIDLCMRFMSGRHKHPFSDEQLLLLCVYICHKYFTAPDRRLTWNTFSRGSDVHITTGDLKHWEFEIISSDEVNFIIFRSLEVKEKTIGPYLRAFQLVDAGREAQAASPAPSALPDSPEPSLTEQHEDSP